MFTKQVWLLGWSCLKSVGLLLQMSAQAAEAEAELADDELMNEFEEAKRSRSLSSIFNGESDEEVIEVDATQQDESLSVSHPQLLVAPKITFT